jgi:hypothetical protein
MARSEWEAKAAFMREVGATEATWGATAFQDEALLSLKLAPQAKPAPPAPPAGPAAKLAEAFQQRLKREHETRFAASHFKPRLDVPVATDQVPRAVRDREAASGNRAPNKPKRR